MNIKFDITQHVPDIEKSKKFGNAMTRIFGLIKFQFKMHTFLSTCFSKQIVRFRITPIIIACYNICETGSDLHMVQCSARAPKNLGNEVVPSLGHKADNGLESSFATVGAKGKILRCAESYKMLVV